MIKLIILGIVQGFTEFFPVSSSAHLVIGQKMLGLSDHIVATTVILHFGTLVALAIFFFKDILKALRDPKLFLFIIIVTFITGAIGLTGRDLFEKAFSSISLVSIALIATGIILLLTRRINGPARKNVNFIDAIILGFAQAIAIIPGISRSGSTISTLLFRKIEREQAFKVSFLASMPAVFGAALLEAKGIVSSIKADCLSLSLGFFSSLASGLLALWLLKIVLHKAKFYYFGYYCIMIGVLSLVFLRN